jgi:tripartite-type tricarboxylate transporter receptor subunit TctC
MKTIWSLMLACLAAATLTAEADDYPNRPIRFIVPYAAGGNGDSLARVLAQELSKRFGQQVVVENKPGASLIIGTKEAIAASPDGYTLLLGSTSSWAMNVAGRNHPPYDPLRDLTPIYELTENPLYLAVHPSVPARSVIELIAYAKTKPGQLNYGSIGIGSSYHLAGELFKSMAGVDILHVPYKGEAPATTDLLAGRVQLMFGGLAPLQPHFQAGNLRLLAMTSSKRVMSQPDVPTVAESGVPGYEALAGFGIFAPKGLPRSLVERLNRSIAEAVTMPDYRAYIALGGLEPAGGSPEDFAKVIARDIAKWTPVMTSLGLRMD